MQWRSEDGVSLPILVSSLWLTLVLLGASLDVGMFYITRQQLKTVADASALAGAGTARTQMTVMLYRTVWVHHEGSYTDELGNSYSWDYWSPDDNDVVTATGWAEDVWAPHHYRGVSLNSVPAFRSLCDVGDSSTWRVCYADDLVPSSCIAFDDPARSAAGVARGAFDTLQSKWSGGQLQHLQVAAIERSQGRMGNGALRQLDYRVRVALKAEMPTRFLKLFGFDSMPVSADVTARWQGFPTKCVT